MDNKTLELVLLCLHTPLPKSLWCEEVEQMEELFQVVLERCSCKQQFVLKGVVIQHSEKLQHTGSHTLEDKCTLIYSNRPQSAPTSMFLGRAANKL